MVDFVNRFLDPQYTYGLTLLGTDQSGTDLKKNNGYIEFVTTPVAFYLNYPKNHDFDDLGKAMIHILDLRLANGPGGCVGAERCLERDLKSPRSNLRSKQ